MLGCPETFQSPSLNTFDRYVSSAALAEIDGEESGNVSEGWNL
jgi:hypothetical protein